MKYQRGKPSVPRAVLFVASGLSFFWTGRQTWYTPGPFWPSLGGVAMFLGAACDLFVVYREHKRKFKHVRDRNARSAPP